MLQNFFAVQPSYTPMFDPMETSDDFEKIDEIEAFDFVLVEM